MNPTERKPKQKRLAQRWQSSKDKLKRHWDSLPIFWKLLAGGLALFFVGVVVTAFFLWIANYWASGFLKETEVKIALAIFAAAFGFAFSLWRGAQARKQIGQTEEQLRKTEFQIEQTKEQSRKTELQSAINMATDEAGGKTRQGAGLRLLAGMAKRLSKYERKQVAQIARTYLTIENTSTNLDTVKEGPDRHVSKKLRQAAAELLLALGEAAESGGKYFSSGEIYDLSDLSLAHGDFRGLQGIQFFYALGTLFAGARFQFEEYFAVNFEGVDMAGVNFEGDAVLLYANFSDANLLDTNFNKVDLIMAEFFDNGRI